MGLKQQLFLCSNLKLILLFCVVSLCERASSDLEYAFREVGMMNVICAYLAHMPEESKLP